MTFEIFVIALTALAGVFLVSMSFVLTTKNFRSALFFKIAPFFFGCGLLLISLKTGGWI